MLKYKYAKYWITISQGYYIFIASLATFFISLGCGMLYNLFVSEEIAIEKFDISKSKYFTIIIVAVLIAPLLETLIFQKIILSYMIKITKYAKVFVSILFAFAHYGSNKQIVCMFFIGYFLNETYAFAFRRKWNPFFVTTAIHAGYNLIITILFIMSKDL